MFSSSVFLIIPASVSMLSGLRKSGEQVEVDWVSDIAKIVDLDAGEIIKSYIQSMVFQRVCESIIVMYNSFFRCYQTLVHFVARKPIYKNLAF